MSFHQGHALLIGIGNNVHEPQLDLPITAADAEALAGVLRDPELCGYPADQVQVLRDAAATRDGILVALDGLAERTGPDDTVFLFFCGHGGYGNDGDYHLTSHDSRLAGRKVAAGSGVRQGELIAKLRAIRARRLLLVINACHAGAVGPTPDPKPAAPAYTGTPLPTQTAAALLDTGSGRIIITGCRDEQVSYIGPGPLTLFTQALLDGLRGNGTSSKGGFVSTFDLYTHCFFSVEDGVRAGYGGIQEPELTMLRGAAPYAVGLYRGATELGAFDHGAAPPAGTAVREVQPAYARAMLANIAGGTVGIRDNDAATEVEQAAPKADNNDDTGTAKRHSIGEVAVDGCVRAANGYIIGRESLQRMTRGVPANENLEQAQAIVAHYLHALVADLTGLKLGGIDVSASDYRPQPLQLADVYVPLDTTLSIPYGKALPQWLASYPQQGDDTEPETQSASDLDALNALLAGLEVRRVPVLEALAHHRELTLIGKPGSGKSTFGACILLALAQAWQGHLDQLGNLGEHWTRGPLLPVRVVLRRFAEQLPAGDASASAEDLWDFVRHDLVAAGYGMSERTQTYLRQIAHGSGALIVLDGLDECGNSATRKRVLAAVQELMRSAGPECRFLLTARPYAWPDEPDPSRGVYALADLDDRRIEQFIRNWYQALTKCGWVAPGEAERKLADLLQARRRPDLVHLASNPLLLTLMATLHTNRGRLPDDRADLYDESVDLLLLRWNRQIGADRSLLLQLAMPGLKLSDLREALEELAFQVHEQDSAEATDTDDSAMRTPDIGEQRLIRAFQPLLQGSREKAVLVVDYIERRAGLLVGHGERDGERRFSFPHRTFQEFLAAAHLAAKADLAQACARLARANPSHWQVVLPLAARLARAERGASAADALVGGSDVGDCDRPTAVDWSCTLLAGQQLAEIGIGSIAKHRNTGAIAARVAGWLCASLPVHPDDGGLSARRRADAGDLLATLGDPRFNPQRLHLPDDDRLGFVDIPADPDFRIGDRRSNTKRARGISGGILPEHDPNDAPSPTPALCIARYAVTVAQFRAFVEANGVKPHYPDALDDPDNRPVCWVSWHEARRYCNWLTQRLRTDPAVADSEPARRVRDQGWTVTLPSELEWEKAARGGLNTAAFPWGSNADPNRANFANSDIRTTSAVGCFPANGFGLYDMAGNLWEWTRSLWGKNPKQPEFGSPYDATDLPREALDADDDVMRVVRGGSWFDPEFLARCALRGRYHPGEQGSNLGFRVSLIAPPVR